ncbi:MAG: acyl-CoA dehydrogenase family protein [Acidimicrobiales bacterium]
MDFELSTDQEALQEGIRNLCQGRFPMDTVRGLAETGGVDRGLWSVLAETGVFSLVLPEPDGVGLGWADAVLVFEELGRAAVPGPLVATFLAAGTVDGAATGETVVGSVERGDGPVMIESFDQLDVLCVLDDAGVWRVDPAEVSCTPTGEPLDPLTPVHLAGSLPQGERIGEADTATAWRNRGAMLSAALQLGLAEAALDSAVAYAKEREQFGKPIGSFQAVKHMCADMLTLVEVARAAVYAAGVVTDDPEIDDPAKMASVAKITADHAATQCGKHCIQVHGGMGYTWEVDAHLYLKRAWVLEQAFGDSDHHALLMADRL